MKRQAVLLSLSMALWAWASTAGAQTDWLVTPEEAQAAREAGPMLVARSTPQAGAPRIDVLEPDLSKPVRAPARIELKFSGSAQAEPRPESFKAFYGVFRLDITQRLLKFAKVTPEGISVSQAELPSGKHQLLLTLSDSQGRQTQQLLSFTVQ